jgi:hypothetical protein
MPQRTGERKRPLTFPEGMPRMPENHRLGRVEAMSDQCRPKRPARAEKSRQRIEERRRRLAAALRENLQRRKEQVRARQAEAAAEGEPSPEVSSE